MATVPIAKDMSAEEIEELLEDRKNGMGLQKAAKKYGVGVPKIRRIEKDNGMEVALPAKKPQLSIEDIQKHFQEVQESFAIVLDDVQNTKAELLGKLQEVLDKLHAEDVEALEEMQEEALEEMQDVQEEMQDVQEKLGLQIGNSTLFGIAGVGLAVVTLLQHKEPARPLRYYTPPTHVEPKEAPKKSKIPEME